MKSKYLAPLISASLTGFMLIVALLAMFSPTLGWFATNKSVSASGLSVTSVGIPKTEQEIIDGGEDIFAEMMPGERRSVTLRVKNLSGKPIIFRLHMSAPTEASDSVYVEDGLWHYFGTQVRLNSVKIGDSDTDSLILEGADKYLLPLEDSQYTGGLPPTALEFGSGDGYDFSSLSESQLTDAINLASGEEITLTLEFEFVDNGEVQNAYISFADHSSGDAVKASLNLSRTLICYFDFAE